MGPIWSICLFNLNRYLIDLIYWPVWSKRGLCMTKHQSSGPSNLYALISFLKRHWKIAGEHYHLEVVRSSTFYWKCTYPSISGGVPKISGQYGTWKRTTRRITYPTRPSDPHNIIPSHISSPVQKERLGQINDVFKVQGCSKSSVLIKSFLDLG
jgi:hypothetical protein